MTETTSGNKVSRCIFCCAPENEVKYPLHGSLGFICDECIELGVESLLKKVPFYLNRIITRIVRTQALPKDDKLRAKNMKELKELFDNILKEEGGSPPDIGTDVTSAAIGSMDFLSAAIGTEEDEREFCLALIGSEMDHFRDRVHALFGEFKEKVEGVIHAEVERLKAKLPEEPPPEAPEISG